MSEDMVETKKTAATETSAEAIDQADGSETTGNVEEVRDEERDFERRNIIGFIIGFLLLVIGMVTLGTGSTTLSPFLIIGGYVIIGISLII